MLELREAHRHYRGNDTTPVEVRDIVVVHGVNQPRGFWKLPRVMRAIMGLDGKIRGAVIQVATSLGQPTTLHHPIQCLHPLEVNSKEAEPQQTPPLTNDNTEGSIRVAVQCSK